MEMDYGHGETRNHDLDRLSALIRIAPGLAEGMLATIEDEGAIRCFNANAEADRKAREAAEEGGLSHG
jgi:hypothetical protein